MGEPAKRLIVALDVPSEEEALRVVDLLSGKVAMFKVGLELIYGAGLSVVPKILNAGARVFLDTKLMDIPATVAGASKGITRLGVSMFNVHASGGSEMMIAAAKAAQGEAELAGSAKPILLAVTLLTSIDRDTAHRELEISTGIEEHVGRLAELAAEAGLDGVVASPNEISIIRERVHKGFAIVTPGVRPQWAAANDQKRTRTPGEAITLGADYLVIGRPITSPPKSIGGPREAIERILEEIDSAEQAARH
ncbi:MAG TPA: orotidine-5'-phosphate decarboxylase [Blastocatellia bacterium]